MDPLTLLLVIAIVLALFSLPAWPYSRGWGYAPSGIFSLVLIVVLVMMLV